MKQEPVKTERKTLHLPVETIQALEKLAARNGTDFSKEVRRAVDEYLDLETTAENLDPINGVIRQELNAQIKALGQPAGRPHQPPHHHIGGRLLRKHRHYR